MTSAINYGNRMCFRICFAVSLLSAILGGCGGFSEVGWKTYSNSRYGFEFPYPENWQSLPAPENGDGIVFVSPQDVEAEIRGWAGNRLPSDFEQSKGAKKTINPNFQTKQGIKGILLVEVTSQQSLMTLTLTQGQIKYYWQGRCNTQDFNRYYRFFYYTARQYKVKSAEL
jgi:hypothetical protein